MHPVTPRKERVLEKLRKDKHCIDPIFCTVKVFLS